MFSRTLAAFVLFAGVNLALAHFSVAIPSARTLDAAEVVVTPEIEASGKPASWWLARTYINSERVPDIVVCGSSQIGGLQAADANTTGQTIDFVSNRRCLTIEVDIEKRLGVKPVVFLSALPGAMVSDHFAIARALYREGAAPSLLVLTVSPRDFIDNTLTSAGATDSYRYFSQFSDLSSYTNLAFHDPWSRFTYFVSTELPVRRLAPVVATFIDSLEKTETKTASGQAAYSKNDGELKTTTATAAEQVKFVMGGYGGNLKPGQAVLTPNLPKIYVDNTNDYKHRYADSHPPTYEVQFTYMREFLKELKGRNIKVLVVGMPLTEVNRKLLSDKFWQGFKRNLQAQCERAGAQYLDLSTASDFSQADFCDTVHLNADGGIRLAQHISDAIAASPELSSALTARIKASR